MLARGQRTFHRYKSSTHGWLGDSGPQWVTGLGFCDFLMSNVSVGVTVSEKSFSRARRELKIGIQILTIV